jgi:hypothetical protein
VASDGGVFSFGVPFEGGLGDRGVSDVIGIAPAAEAVPPGS